MMQDYANIPQKRLQQLAKHYISHARMQIMEGRCYSQQHCSVTQQHCSVTQQHCSVTQCNTVVLPSNTVVLPSATLQCYTQQHCSVTQHHCHKRVTDVLQTCFVSENIHMNRPVNEDIDDVLSRLDELYLLVGYILQLVIVIVRPPTSPDPPH